MDATRQIAVLGVTGSIGRSTCDVIRHGGTAARIVAMSASSDVEGLVAAAREFAPEVVAMVDPAAGETVRNRLRDTAIQVLASADSLETIARWPDIDLVVNAIVGAAGLRPSLAALEAGRTLALANKESLVAAGQLITATANDHDATILPIDSEHCSLFQCLEGRSMSSVREVVLTASGGPFRQLSLAEIDRLPPREALSHPTWQMGERITVDSATLMNKGFEVIEAHWLFGFKPDRIRVVVHPQSVVHAMVVLSDGSAIAHLSTPDMRLPIEFVLSYPQAPRGRFETLDLTATGRLEFEPPDRGRFPCLRLAEEALATGGTLPAVLNAADEVAVTAYLDGRLRFTGIAEVVEEVLASHSVAPGNDLAEILEADGWAREAAATRIIARNGAGNARGRVAPAG